MTKCFILSLLILPVLIHAQTTEKSVVGSNGERIGFLEFRPSDYSAAKHPLIIFLHGIGEKGNGTTELRKVHCCGIPAYIRGGNKMRFTWQGKTESFVVLSPQLSKKYSMWQPFYTDAMIKYAIANLNKDPNRIFVTGLSMGGGGTWNFASSSQARAEELAGIAPVVAPCMMSNGCNIAKASLPVLAIHVWDDKDAPVSCTINALKSINACGPSVSPCSIIYDKGGHYVWVRRAFDTAHTYQNPNMFEWFLAQNKSYSPNKKPIARAGSDLSVTTADATITLNGEASSDPDGKIVRYIWTKILGPNYGVLTGAGSATPQVSELKVAGTYKYQIKAIDNRAEWSLDTVTVTVVKGEATPNDKPSADAGEDTTVILPAEYTLNGSGSKDPDGSITGYLWSKVDGPDSYQFSDEWNVKNEVSNLAAGVYTFRLKVTDNRGATSTDDIKVTVVNPAEPDPDSIPGNDSVPDGGGHQPPSNIPPPSITAQQIVVYPNPTKSNIVLSLNTPEKGAAVAVIYDNMGRVMKKVSFVKSQFSLQQTLHILNLGRGLFIVDVIVGRTARFRTKFIKQ
jgi:hypothetical protein